MTTATLIAPLWQRTRASFARAIEAIGAPVMIAAIRVLTRKLRREIVGRILRLEHLVRKLLLAEATELHRAELARAKRAVRIELIPLRGMAQTWAAGLQARTCTSVKERCASEDARSKTNRAAPETWRAQFTFALPRQRYLPNSHAPRILDPWGPPPPPAPERTPRVIKQDTPFRLACRLEALRRVLENPKPHAERLLRVLIREARRVPQLIQRYAHATARTNDYDKADHRLGIDTFGACIDAPFAFSDTS